MTPSIMHTMPVRVPPIEKAGENTVAMATPAKVIRRLSTSFKSALCRNRMIPRISVMHGIVATKIALIDAEVSLTP